MRWDRSRQKDLVGRYLPSRVMTARPPPSGSGTFFTSSLKLIALMMPSPNLGGIDATGLFTETLSLVVGDRRSGSPQGSPLSLPNLADQELALLTVEFATRRHIDAYFRENRISPRIMVDANSIQAVIEIVSRTELATVLPDAITHDHPQLVPVPLAPILPRTVVLLRREHAYQTAASRAFTQLVERWVHARGYRRP